MTALPFVSPVFCNLLRGLVQPIFVRSQTDHLDRRKPLGRIRGRIAERRQLAHGHQNLNVMLREAGQLRRRRDIKTCWQTFGRPGCRSFPAARFRHSAELNGATKAALNFPLYELRTQTLAKILSAGQKDTEMAGVFERHQIINTPKTFINWALCRYLPGGCPGWHRRC